MTVAIASSAHRAIEEQKPRLLALASNHECSAHPLFDYLRLHDVTRQGAARLLRNYDAHATVLRRLLLKAASIMPETAAGYVLENVRNEYGNGNPDARHQLQLRHLAEAMGVSANEFARVRIEPGVRRYIREVIHFYNPKKSTVERYYRPAVVAGAITATEILALAEFRAMQCAFRTAGLDDHIWFDHVKVEAEHTDESLALALHFIQHADAVEAVEFGMTGVLDANCHLYDGLLSALSQT